jgi:SET domain-containing protein
MSTNNTTVKVTDQYGRGVYATDNIDSGRWIECAEVLALNEADTALVNNTDLKDYTFKFDDKTDCLVLGNGEIYNHAGNPNVSYTLMNINSRFQMVFKAIKDIKVGEQLFIDYNSDVPNSTVEKNYSVNLLK